MPGKTEGESALNLHPTQAGLTLIEMAVGLVIIAILMALAAPSFRDWIHNIQIRGAAESIQNGLQLARAEAVRRNASIRFNMNAASGIADWEICATPNAPCPPADVIQSKAGLEGASIARAGISTNLATPFSTALAAGDGLPAGITFNSIGRVPTANVGVDIARIDLTSATYSKARRLVVTVSSGGSIRMCDPAISLATNALGCS